MVRLGLDLSSSAGGLNLRAGRAWNEVGVGIRWSNQIYKQTVCKQLLLRRRQSNLQISDFYLSRLKCSALLSILQFRQMTDQAAANEQLNLKVKSQDGEEVFFKIKSSTQLKKLMDAYCQRQSLNAANVRFLFDGERLHETQTPKDLNMENGDEIDVVIEQVGGK